jgi:hypothetical protein
MAVMLADVGLSLQHQCPRVSVANWNTNRSYSVSDGQLNLNDAMLSHETLPAIYGPGRTVEFVRTWRK